MEVLSPSAGVLDTDWNKNSLVLRIHFGKFCALLMGDALIETERVLLDGMTEKLKCPVIQIGHHGSKFSSSQNFIAATEAKVGIISINADNIRGYPSADVINAWEKNGTKIYSTYQRGSIECQANKDGTYEITTGH